MDKIPSHRRWRGVSDTLTDFIRWLRTWKKMLVFLLSRPRQTVQGLVSYGLAEAFFSLPTAVDSYIGNAAGAKLREKHGEISAYLQDCFACAAAVFRGSEKGVYIEGECAEIILHGFPGLKAVSLPTALLLFAGEEKKLPTIGRCCMICAPQYEKYAPSPVFLLKNESGAIIDCIRFLEKHTGERFDWDVFTAYLSNMTGEKSKSPGEAIELLTGRYL